MSCPLCGKKTPGEGNAWRPFCSERCQLTDLGLWAGEEYRIPGPTLMVNPLESEPGETE